MLVLNLLILPTACLDFFFFLDIIPLVTQILLSICWSYYIMTIGKLIVFQQAAWEPETIRSYVPMATQTTFLLATLYPPDSRLRLARRVPAHPAPPLGCLEQAARCRYRSAGEGPGPGHTR